MKKRRLRQNEKRERAAGRKVRMIDNDETFEKKTFQKIAILQLFLKK
jgi:hypothetical protein